MSNLRPGKYAAKVIGTQHGISEKGGKDYIVVTFDVPFSDGTSESISTWLYFVSDENSRISMESLRAAGWDGLDIVALNGVLDSAVELVLEEEIYDNKPRLKVKFVNKPGGVKVEKPMNDGQKVAFANRMKGLMLAAQKANGQPTPAAKPPARPANHDGPPPGRFDDADDFPR